MRTIVTTVIFSLLLTNINASEKAIKPTDVPDVVKNSFNQKYPNVSVNEWAKEKDNTWEAEFKLNGIEYEACFDNNGNWQETEQEISINDIPATVKATLEKEFAGYKIEDPELIETATGKTSDFELEKEEIGLEVSIDIEGKVVKNEQEKD